MRKASKIDSKKFILIFLVFVVWIFSFIKLTQSYDINISIKNKILYINSDYGTNLNISDINEINLLDNIPSMKKIEGKNSMKSYVGVFDVENYGRSRVYLEDKNSSNCIALKINEEYVFINLKSDNETKSIYEVISSLIVK